MTKEEEDGNKKIWLSLPLENQSVQKFQSFIGPKPIQMLGSRKSKKTNTDFWDIKNSN